MTKTKYPHLDMFGEEIDEGDYVLALYNGSLEIHEVLGLAAKTMTTKHYQVKKPRNLQRRYAIETVKLNRLQVKAIAFNVMRGK